MQFDPFVQVFGKPNQGTGANLEPWHQINCPDLEQFVQEVGGGVFAGGILSIASIREQVDTLFQWHEWLPGNARLFATSAFGTLFCMCGRTLWVVDTHYGQVIESDISILEFLNSLSESDTLEEVLRKALFDNWMDLGGILHPTHVLCPTPEIALGGQWSVDGLAPWTLPAHLSFTSQLFSRSAGMPAEVRRL